MHFYRLEPQGGAVHKYRGEATWGNVHGVIGRQICNMSIYNLFLTLSDWLGEVPGVAPIGVGYSNIRVKHVRPPVRQGNRHGHRLMNAVGSGHGEMAVPVTQV